MALRVMVGVTGDGLKMIDRVTTLLHTYRLNRLRVTLKVTLGVTSGRLKR